MKAVPFFLDTIKIVPHTATQAEHVGKPITIAEFAAGRPCAVYETDNGELYVAAGYDHPADFIQGPEDSTLNVSLVYLGTCQPCYFLGFGGHTYAVPLSAKPRNYEVRRDLLACISSEELFVNAESVEEDVYSVLRSQAAEFFDGYSPLARWNRACDDLSESYAYFGVKVS